VTDAGLLAISRGAGRIAASDTCARDSARRSLSVMNSTSQGVGRGDLTPAGDFLGGIGSPARGCIAGDDARGPAAGHLQAALAELEAYFAGTLRAFSVSLDLGDVAAFDARSWLAAIQVPYGETASYGEVAAMAGSPLAARAVGRAMARCSLFPIVPCHRVIHADGSIRGWGGDLWVKRWLLDFERNVVDGR
jgi:O-6-methylguanine DNA methyltransferase